MSTRRSGVRVFRGAIVLAFLVSPSIARTQAFSKIVITPSASTDTRESRLQILPSGELIAHAVPFVELLSIAYDIPENPSPRVSPLPEWAVNQRFDIEGKVPVSKGLDSKDVATQRWMTQHLIRSLLADRFGLQLTVKTERMLVYGLYVGNAGANLTKAALSHCILDTSPEGCHSFAPGFGHP